MTSAAGCPPHLGSGDDVSNDAPELARRLVRPGAIAALICRYGSAFSTVGRLPAGPALARSVRLGAADTARLIAALDHLDTSAPSGAAACALDAGSATILVFAYTTAPDVDLWYHDSGCRSVANGVIGAWEVGRPAFYARFMPLLDSFATAPMQAATP